MSEKNDEIGEIGELYCVRMELVSGIAGRPMHENGRNDPHKCWWAMISSSLCIHP